MKTLVLSGENHGFDKSAPVIAAFLVDCGIDAEMTDDKDALHSLDGCDALVLGTGFTKTERRDDGRLAHLDDLTPTQEQGLFDYVAAGGGLVGVHGTAWWIPSRAVPLLGGHANWHPPGLTFQVQIEDDGHPITADVVIDTCGDGDVFAAAGCEHATETVAPWLWFTMGGVQDVAAAAEAARCFQTIGEGHVLLPWGATERISRMIDATKPEDITFALLECRELVMEEIDRLRRDVPQFRDAYITHIADQLGVTESRRLVGEYVLTREEMDRPHDDDIAVTGHWTKYGALYHIPYGSLLAREYQNLLTAGRSISVDHRVHHATKEIPACMATGEAAGTAAAMSLSLGGTLKQVDITALQRRLVERGAIVAA